MAGAARYSNETVQKLILQMKYEGWASASPPLGSLFSSYLKNLPHDFKDYHVVPVPLHKNKEWRRGFNQAALLGGAVSTALHLPVINRNLVRIKETAAQTDQADYTTREANIAGAFHIEHPHEFKGKNILLIDDVTTSGATLREAARTLKAAGVKKIIGAVAARAH
jgi:ComF family protein